MAAADDATASHPDAAAPALLPSESESLTPAGGIDTEAFWSAHQAAVKVQARFRGRRARRAAHAADVEMLPPPRTYTDAEFTKLEARLLAAHGQATKDGALGTVLDAAATEVLFRLTGQHGLQFRDCQRDVLEHIIYGARSTFYLTPCGAGKALVLWVLAA